MRTKLLIMAIVFLATPLFAFAMDMSTFQAALNSKLGDANYNAAADFNEDGVVDLADYNLYVSGAESPSVSGPIDMTTFQAAFNSKLGDANYNPAADFNKDGVVDLTDYNLYVSGAKSPVETGAISMPTFQAAFNSKLGDPNYNPAADFNEDGVIDLTDYNLYVGGAKSPAITGPIDFSAFQAAFNSKLGDANYNPAADFNEDGVVDLTDYNLYVSGKTYHKTSDANNGTTTTATTTDNEGTTTMTTTASTTTEPTGSNAGGNTVIPEAPASITSLPILPQTVATAAIVSTTTEPSTSHSNRPFTSYLKEGMTNNDVARLQNKLRTMGFFTYPVTTGFFGPVTRSAVKSFQSAHKLPATGYVGPLTTTYLNK